MTSWLWSLSGMAIGITQHGDVDAVALGWIALKVLLYFGAGLAIGYWVFPLFKHPFRNREGHGFTFRSGSWTSVWLVAEAIGLHIILGAYLAGLFLKRRWRVRTRAEGIRPGSRQSAYSFLGPIFFISLGLSHHLRCAERRRPVLGAHAHRCAAHRSDRQCRGWPGCSNSVGSSRFLSESACAAAQKWPMSSPPSDFSSALSTPRSCRP